MGANPQTTVQKSDDGAILTAAQQKTSAATGVPVFATTVTRDAAFGGANKVLAEGQLAYIEASDTVQYYSGAAWLSVGEVSKVVQIVNAQFNAAATGSTQIPNDDSIPQITEGDQYMTLAITPASASNILNLTITAYAANTSAQTQITVALFQDATANALAVGSWRTGTQSNAPATIAFTYRMVAGTTSATTFRIRIGAGDAGTITFNGAGGARNFGDIPKSSITITESTP